MPKKHSHEIHPGGMGRDVMEVDPGMALEPLLSRRVFVNIEVVQNDMQLTVGEVIRHLVHEV